MRARQPAVGLFLMLVPACTVAPADGAGLLHAVAWTQTAVEREILCAQVFAAATDAVRAGPQDSGGRPRAAVVDVDETVLDNAPYQARLVLARERFAPASWNAWCREARAAAIPGAVAFAQECHARGVTVFYVTNRAADLEEATRRNLAAAGFPLADAEGGDVVLTRGEVDGRSGKAGRRARVAERFEIVVMAGDDLHDFVDAEPDPEARRRAARQHAGSWGRTWFMLPNPMYGSWERALPDAADDPSAAKQAALRR